MFSSSPAAGKVTHWPLAKNEVAAAEAWVELLLDDRRWRRLSYLLLLVALLVAAITARDYGLTWDEENHRIYGDAVLNWYSSIFANHDAVDKWRLFIYGGFFDALAQMAARVSPQGVYETRHAVSALFGLLGIAAAYRIGSRLLGGIGGFLSALFLLLTPVYYGHMFNNPKDVPFAALFLVSLYYSLVAYDRLPNLPKRTIVQLGAVVGLTAGIRVVGILILGYLALLWFTWLVGSHRFRSLPPGASRFVLLGKLALSWLSVGSIAWVVMLVSWPWAQLSPIANPLDTLLSMTAYDWPLTVLFNGEYVPAKALPPSYLPTWLAISLPEFYFVALAVGGLLAIRFCLSRGWSPYRWDLMAKVGLLTFAVAAPILAAIALKSTIYDGLRQFLFVVPPLAVLAGISLAALLKSRALLPLKLLAVSAALFSAGLTLFDMADLHPYEYVFFNRSVAGGLESAYTRFDTEYYGSSYREGVRWLIDNYHPESTERIRVANASKAFLTGYYLEMSDDLRRRFVEVQPGDDPNIYLSTTRWNKHNVKGRILHIVSREGAPLLYVIEVRRPS